MDSITHLALGAVIGEAVAGKSIGKKAMIIGALAQSIPDIDFVQSFWLSPVDNLLAHRGFTHSILFGLLISALLGWLCSRWKSSLSVFQWSRFLALEIAVHLCLDSLNNYGIGWLEPFSHQRVSFDVIFVADPFYSIWIGIGAVALWIIKTNVPVRKHWVLATLIISTLYLAYAVYNKSVAERAITGSLNDRQIAHTRLLTTPSPFNNWLWFFAAEVDSGYYVGYRSVFDKSKTVDFHFFPRRQSLLDSVKDEDVTGKLLRFSRGYYTLETRHDTLVFNDLRFGQSGGWSDPHAEFAFHYYINFPAANLLVVQRGRFENWNKKTISDFVERIMGSPK